jgi:hypothetical protein
MLKLKSIFAALIIAIAGAIFSNAARAANYQDMWWVPTESGWGINIAHQGDVMFATWFIYGLNGQPTWIFLSNAPRSGATGNTFTGDIFQATGTPFATVPFVSQNTALTKAGTATIVFSDARNGTLTYNIGAAQVVKQITRINLDTLNLTGTYYGGLFRSAGCTNSGVGNSIFSVTHTPSLGTVSIVEVGGDNCRFTGTLNQLGSVVAGSGSYTCQGETGTWTGAEGVVGETTFAFKLSLQTPTGVCVATFGGFKSP